VSQYQKGETNLDFTEARDGEWQWHPLGQTVNHASNPPLTFFKDGCPSCRPTKSVKALKATQERDYMQDIAPTKSAVQWGCRLTQQR